ncbi:UDP-N-acetylmuramate dehydrogenase [Nesterenkonia populi]|uniref:UDP-N-acetylmuramate dehydrogenase n=1 Tax=Nesterenkonia populi TaxID=1591087 RepID=UPI0011BDFB18|nr:UDP-N-acetylmuramate dehydrogenase [Nesterenkonia populi]
MTVFPSLDAAVLARLEEAVPDLVSTRIELSRLSRWRIGGNADALVEPSNEQQVSAVLRVLLESKTPYCVVGDTSNLLFDSEGLRGVLIRIASEMSGINIEGRDVAVKAGTSVPKLARRVGARGLTGIEHTVGIPGTIGGLVLMNGGSQRKGIGSHVTWVRYVDTNGEVRVIAPDECHFSYRSSALQTRGGVIVEVGLRLEEGDPHTINAEMDHIVESRRARFPEDHPNCGSTFLSNPAMYSTAGPPGQVIEQAGFKGKRIGGAQVSPQHANFINNVGAAKSDDVLELIRQIRETVRTRTGFVMDSEARYVTPDSRVLPVHEEADRRPPSVAESPDEHPGAEAANLPVLKEGI